MLPPPPRSLLFPYTTLFRSNGEPCSAQCRTTITGCGVAMTLTSEPSSATSTSPPRTTAPRGRNTPSRRPCESSVSRSEEHTSELQSPDHLVCRLLLEKKKKK